MLSNGDDYMVKIPFHGIVYYIIMLRSTQIVLNLMLGRELK